MKLGLVNRLRKNAILFLTVGFVLGVSGIIILLGLREGQGYHVTTANPTCNWGSTNPPSSVDCSCCHQVKMGMPTALFKSVINGKPIPGSYYDANGYVYILARARHDGTAPVITAGPSVVNITYTTATINWTTNENSTTWVDWGLTIGYGNNVGNGSYVTSHSVNLTGLTNHLTYHYRITSTDVLGNTLVTGDYTFTPNLPPPVPTVIDQPDHIASSTITVTLNWNPVTDPDGGTPEYQVIIDDDPFFGSPNYTSGWTSGTSWTVDVAPGYYYSWKVRSRDAAYPTAVSDWSAPDVFYVLSAAPPDTPTLISPVNGFYDYTLNITYGINFSWNPVTAPDGDPINYLVEVSQASDFSVLYASSGWIPGTTWSLSVGVPATYYWRVRARDSVHTDSVSHWSTVFTFFIDYWGGILSPGLCMDGQELPVSDGYSGRSSGLTRYHPGQ